MNKERILQAIKSNDYHYVESGAVISPFAETFVGRCEHHYISSSLAQELGIGVVPEKLPYIRADYSIEGEIENIYIPVDFEYTSLCPIDAMFDIDIQREIKNMILKKRLVD